MESGNEQSRKRKKVVHTSEESEDSDKTDLATKVKFSFLPSESLSELIKI
jgi:hypothetical protein